MFEKEETRKANAYRPFHSRFIHLKEKHPDAFVVVAGPNGRLVVMPEHLQILRAEFGRATYRFKKRDSKCMQMLIGRFIPDSPAKSSGFLLRSYGAKWTKGFFFPWNSQNKGIPHPMAMHTRKNESNVCACSSDSLKYVSRHQRRNSRRPRRLSAFRGPPYYAPTETTEWERFQFRNGHGHPTE